MIGFSSLTERLNRLKEQSSELEQAASEGTNNIGSLDNTADCQDIKENVSDYLRNTVNRIINNNLKLMDE